MANSSRSPFDLPLTPEQRTTLGLWLAYELDNAVAARSAQEAEIDYWHALYEQARTRNPKSLPWPDAADLTSHIPCEKVDAIHARLMRTVWVNPVWTVEGWGKAASRAPFVEEFHQWKVEEERLQSVLDKLSLNALIEPRGLVEVYESSERRPARKQIHAKPQTTPEGGLVFDAQGQPQLATDPQGQFQEADPQDMAVTTVIDSSDVVRTGPQYRVLPYRDSLILPGHARDKEEIWGYAKRLWPRLGDLKAKAKDGLYDVDAVDSLTTVGDREPNASLSRAQQDIAPQRRETAEKELWEALVLVDVNSVLESRGQTPLKDKGAKTGARWYLATIHLRSQTLLRFQHDDFERSRYVPFILFPRPDRATEGFSLIGHKLVTVTEEHTAFRNMAADKTSMAVNAPILKMQGALWDEDEQPWGPKQVITVRDPRELTPMIVPDVPASVFQHIERCERTSDRLAGINDIASGQVAQESRTLGEIQMATEQSFVRMDLVVRRFQESMEDLAQIRHAIWKRVLAERVDGMEAPESVLIGLEGRGVSIDQYLPDKKITAALLEGAFRFKPHGSVETADPNRLRQDFGSAMQMLPMLLQAFPLLQGMFSTPQAARAMGRQFLRVFRVSNQQAFLGSPSQDLGEQTQLDGGMAGGLPGMPGGGANPGMPGLPAVPPGVPPAGGPHPPPPPDPLQLASMEFAHKEWLELALAHIKAETAIAVAEINKRADVFAAERDRIGVQAGQLQDHAHDATQQLQDHLHASTQNALDRAHEAMTPPTSPAGDSGSQPPA